MKTTPEHDKRLANISFATVFPLYVAKIQKKGRTIDELYDVIEWLTGFNRNHVHQLINEEVTFEVFFERATLNPNANLIKGVICGYRIEEIENPTSRKVRYLDKLVDELAKGKSLKKYSIDTKIN